MNEWIYDGMGVVLPQRIECWMAEKEFDIRKQGIV